MLCNNCGIDYCIITLVGSSYSGAEIVSASLEMKNMLKGTSGSDGVSSDLESLSANFLEVT